MCKNIFKIKNICFYQIIKILTHLPVVGPNLTSRSWLHRRLVVVRHCQSPLLTPTTNRIHGSLWINCVHQHTVTQVHGFLKCLFCFAFSLHWEDSSANTISFVALDFEITEAWADVAVIWALLYLTNRKNTFYWPTRTVPFSSCWETSWRIQFASFFLFFLHFNSFFLIYNNFLRLNYWLHV